MTLYECDFHRQKECLFDNPDVEVNTAPLGEYLCKLLSLNFENTAESISQFLWGNWLEKKPFPIEQLQDLVNGICVSSEFDEMRDMAKMLKTLYGEGETQEVVNVYGSLKDAFLSETYECFKVGAILQAYLDESENNPEMLSATSFERFVNGFLEMKISRNDQAYSLGEYDMTGDIFPGCDIKQIVKDAFLSLERMSDEHSIFSMISYDRFMVSSVYYFFLNGYRFKRCRNCGNFFVPLSRSDEIYCNSPSPQDKARSCKEYGSQKLWYDRLKNDEVAKLARNVYSAKQMLVRRNPDISAYAEMFEYFKTERKNWERRVKSGERSREEYLSWLNEMKVKKTL